MTPAPPATNICPVDATITATILESMSDGVLVFDLTGHLVFVNGAACTLLLLERERITDRTYLDIFMGGEENDAFNDILCAGIQEGEVHVYQEVPFRRSDGKEIDLAVTTSFLRGGTEPEGKGSGIVIVFKDITESKALDRARQRVIDHLSHELKTPLAVANATLNSLRKGENNLLVDRIEKNLKRLKEIQQEVEDIVRKGTRGQQGGHGASAMKESPTPQPLMAGALAQAVVDEVREKTGHRDVALFTVIDRDLRISTDEEVFRKAVLTLLKNGVEATPDGGRMEVVVRRRRDRIEVAVTDPGIGITEESRAQIFGGFYHARETDLYSTKKPFDFGAGGKGLELHRLEILSRAYGFDVECESRRCRFLPDEGLLCPGSVALCSHVGTAEECAAAGGTTFRLLFQEARANSGA